MKKILIGIGVLVVILLLVLGGYAWYARYQRNLPLITKIPSVGYLYVSAFDSSSTMEISQYIENASVATFSVDSSPSVVVYITNQGRPILSTFVRQNANDEFAILMTVPNGIENVGYASEITFTSLAFMNSGAVPLDSKGMSNQQMTTLVNALNAGAGLMPPTQ